MQRFIENAFTICGDENDISDQDGDSIIHENTSSKIRGSCSIDAVDMYCSDVMDLYAHE